MVPFESLDKISIRIPHGRVFSRFNTTHERDRRPDPQPVTQTQHDSRSRARRLATLQSRGKKEGEIKSALPYFSSASVSSDLKALYKSFIIIIIIIFMA